MALDISGDSSLRKRLVLANSILKAVIKNGVKRAARITGPFMPRPEASRILTYHSIGIYNHDMTVSASAFMAQMDWIAGNANPITLEEAAQGKPGVAITFDDGYRDNLTEAAPILLRHGIPATVFMIAGCAGELLDSTSEESRIMTWTELRTLREMGIEIGAHSMTHSHLARLSLEEQRREIFESVGQIAEVLGQPVTTFAYPYGSAFDFNEDSKGLVAEAGCTLAVSNRYGVNRPGADRYALRRIWIDATDTMTTFTAKVTGQLDVLTAIDTRPALHARRLLNRFTR